MVTFGRGTDDDSQTSDPGDPPSSGSSSSGGPSSSGDSSSSGSSSRSRTRTITRRERDLTRGAGGTLDESETVSSGGSDDRTPGDLIRGTSSGASVPGTDRTGSGGGGTDRTSTVATDPREGRLERIAMGQAGVRADPTDAVEPAGGDDGLGTIADARVPGTDSTVLDVVDAGDQAFRDRVVEPAARAGRQAGEISRPVGPAGPVEGSEQRGQLGEDFGRSAAQALNVPGFVGGALRAGPRIARAQGDPDAARRAAAAGREVGAEAAGFARENPFRAGAMGGGFLAGAGAATGAARVAGRAGGRSRTRREEIVDEIDTAPSREPGTGGTGSVLDASDIRQPASQPTGSTGRIDRIRAEFDEFLGDTRGQLGGQRQRQRPDDGGGSGPSRPTGDDLLEGSPRDRISGDITARQRADLESARGTFDGAGDPIAPRGGGRGTSPGSRIPRDPLDTRGGRSPTGGSVDPSAVGAGSVGTGAFVAQQLDGDGEFADGLGLTLDGTQATEPAVGPGTGTDPGTGTEPGTTPDVGTEPFVGEGERTGVFETVGGRTAFDTMQQQQRRAATPARPAERVADPTLADPTGAGQRGGRPSGRPRPRRRFSGFDFDSDADDDEFVAAFDADDELFDTGILDPSDAFDEAFDESGFRF